MPLSLIFHPEVEQEVKASYDWYQNQADGLGEDFLSELETAFQTILSMPDTWPKFQTKFRRFILGKFPFSVVYSVTEEVVFIVAVMHHSRRPEYWLHRADFFKK